MAEQQGVEVAALKERPNFTADELFYWRAFNVLSDAGYSDISQFCVDNCLDICEREDLLRVLNTLNGHNRGLLKNANS